MKIFQIFFLKIEIKIQKSTNKKANVFFNFKELQMRRLFEYFADKDQLIKYLADYKAINKIDKYFFLNIINTIKTNFID